MGEAQMTTIGQKADYVRSEAKRNETFDHHCHWPGCPKKVPPAMWGCKAHWFKLPLALRNKIWATYAPGQEISKDPSAEYLAVADEVQAWIRSHDHT
jgi:hypothetical protein